MECERNLEEPGTLCVPQERTPSTTITPSATPTPSLNPAVVAAHCSSRIDQEVPVLTGLSGIAPSVPLYAGADGSGSNGGWWGWLWPFGGKSSHQRDVASSSSASDSGGHHHGHSSNNDAPGTDVCGGLPPASTATFMLQLPSSASLGGLVDVRVCSSYYKGATLSAGRGCSQSSRSYKCLAFSDASQVVTSLADQQYCAPGWYITTLRFKALRHYYFLQLGKAFGWTTLSNMTWSYGN